jgi:hypothetical protein
VSPLAAFQARGIDVTFEPGETVDAAVTAAKAADVAIIFGSAHSHEGSDRKDLLFEHGSSTFVKTGPQNCSTTVSGIIGDGFMKSVPASDAGACCTQCWADTGCVAFTYTSGSCYFKDNIKTGGSGKSGDHKSGVIPGRAPHPSPGPPPPGAAIEDLIVAVGAVNKKTIVCAAIPGQILTDWRDDVAAILIAFLPGEQYGNAIADLIYGDAIPQAKSPLSFPNKANEQGMTAEQCVSPVFCRQHVLSLHFLFLSPSVHFLLFSISSHLSRPHRPRSR